MRRATAFAALALVPIVLAGLPLLVWLASAALAPGGSSAAPVAADSLTCTVKNTDCNTGVGEVEVFRMYSPSNAHAGTPGGSAYGYRVCCGGVTGLDDNCSGTHATVLALSGLDNAHVATSVGGNYTTEVCLSAPSGSVACTYPTSPADCTGGQACVAKISGTANAHVADCAGSDPYATKVCCSVGTTACVAGNDTDNDDFNDEVEWWISTDCEDDCPDVLYTDDAWPLDIDMTRDIDVTGDVYNYVGRIGATGGHASDPSCPEDTPMWWQRLDLQPDCSIDVTGDVFNFVGKIGLSCS